MYYISFSALNTSCWHVALLAPNDIPHLLSTSIMTRGQKSTPKRKVVSDAPTESKKAKKSKVEKAAAPKVEKQPKLKTKPPPKSKKKSTKAKPDPLSRSSNPEDSDGGDSDAGEGVPEAGDGDEDASVGVPKIGCLICSPFCY
jgi:outer membrane biosynthesis protein TonB